jgi:16S rRNA processing protein RimM
VPVGRLGRPHGLEGFVGLYIEAEDLVAHFEPGSVVYLNSEPYTVRATRPGKKGPQVAFEEVTDRQGAEAIRGREVFVGRRRPLGEGEFWPEDLVGLEVRPGGGQVVGISNGPAQDRLVVERGELLFEVPFVRQLVPTVDLENGYVEIDEIEGLSSPSDQT